MAKKHFYLQGKGGVGKSFSAAAYAQYKINKQQNPACFDTDPINATFHGYQALNVKRVNIMEGDEINSRHFDTLIEELVNTTEDAIIDNGASSFVPLSHYLISHRIPALLHENGHEVFIHTVITGGQAILDTINGFAQLATQMPEEVKFVVWLNPFWGAVEYEGKPFEKMKVYETHKERIAAIVRIPAVKMETYGRDLSDMLQARQTFKEALDSPLPIMVRQRLKIVQDELFKELDKAVIL
jgi:hypothetical protein